MAVRIDILTARGPCNIVSALTCFLPVEAVMHFEVQAAEGPPLLGAPLQLPWTGTVLLHSIQPVSHSRNHLCSMAPNCKTTHSTLSMFLCYLLQA